MTMLTGWLVRISTLERETKQQPNRARLSHQLSCYLVSHVFVYTRCRSIVTALIQCNGSMELVRAQNQIQVSSLTLISRCGAGFYNNVRCFAAWCSSLAIHHHPPIGIKQRESMSPRARIILPKLDLLKTCGNRLR